MKTNRITPNNRFRMATCLSLVALAILLLPHLYSRSSTALAQLSIARTNTDIIITWTNSGTLQYTPGLSFTTVWTNLPLATSPYIFPPTNQQAFYRLLLTPPPTNFAFRYVPIEFTIAIGDPAPSACGCVAPEGSTTSGGGGIPGISQDNGMGSVALATGEVIQHAVDLQIPGRGFDWRFERHYRSGITYDGPAGQGWEFNYNRRLFVEANGSVLRMDGAGRADRYVLTNSVYQAPNGFYTRLIRNNIDGTFLERDRHGLTHLYSTTNALGVAHLTQIADRDGNQMTFQYNGGEQLTNAVDTLGRSIRYNYDVSGRLTNVTDFTGRQLLFGYDANGDLVSVTSPVVTNTPTGNDYPSGKTTRYSYSSGYVDPRFNHNLLTRTAPNEAAIFGPSYLSVVYDTSPSSTNADRVLQLTLGGSNASGIPSGGTIQYAYTNLATVATNDFITAVAQNTVTDRKTNTTEYRFNQIGNIVRVREFTSGLRGTDPAFFETSSEFNKDGEMTRRIYAEGDSVTNAFDTSNSDRFQQGNLLSVRHLPGPRGGDQSQLVASYTYETNFNFVVTDTDARSNITQYAYNATGNCTNIIHRIPSIVENYEYNTNGQTTAHILPNNGSGHRRRDAMTYYSSGPQKGYLQQTVVDSGTLNLTTTYEYDDAGNLTRMIDPSSNDTIYVVNQLNQIVRTSSPAVSTTNGLVRYQRDLFYDANDNVIRTDIQNIDDGGNIVASLPNFTTTNIYDILDYVLSTSQQVTNNYFITNRYRYDANNNRTIFRSGVATSGLQTNNLVSTQFDERDLVFKEIRAPGSADQSTTQQDYDRDRNLVRVSQGTESSPRIATFAFDGYNRQTVATNAMGNVAITHYDANGNSVSNRVDGELVDVAGSAGNVRLSETSYTYDAMDRQSVSDAAFFDTATQTNFGSGHAVIITTFSDNSQVLTSMDANSNVTTIAYDTACRRSLVTDAKSNTVTYAYDPNDNVIETTELDQSDLGSSSQTFVTTNVFDSVNRRIQTIDNIGITNRYAYDSRDNNVAAIDGRGNVTRYDYDGLNRLTTTTRFLTSNGLGSGTPAGSIVTVQTYDDNSRLTAQTDANTNSTVYVYDALDRSIRTVYADGTTNSAAYDVHNNVTTATDANGSVVNLTYDLGNRAIAKAITPGSGVLGTTNETYQYDGVSRVVRSQNDNSIVTSSYDSLSDVLRETQQLVPGGTTQTVTSAFDANGNRFSCTYPGGRIINSTYDRLNRLQIVTNAPSLIAHYDYIGPRRVERREYGNGTRAAFGYDSIRRLTNSLHSTIVGSTNIDSRAYAWDAAHNQTTLNNLLAPAQDSKTFSYDSVDRLIQAATVSAPTNSYTLDGVGNRVTVTGTNAGSYVMNGTVPPADRQMNQYTATPFDSRQYDADGNLVLIDLTSEIGITNRTLKYNYHNELVSYSNATSGATITFKYDCFGRRIQKLGDGTTNRYYYADWQEIEEQDGTNATVATFVWGNGIDELLAMDRSGQRRFFHEDDLGSIRKVTDGTGAIIEQYRYDDYGQPTFLDAAGSLLTNSAIGNSTLFTGRRYDSDTGLYYYRTRYLDSVAGRFTTRDTIGIWGDSANLGNGYAYVANSPASAVDPSGIYKNTVSCTGGTGDGSGTSCDVTCGASGRSFTVTCYCYKSPFGGELLGAGCNWRDCSAWASGFCNSDGLAPGGSKPSFVALKEPGVKGDKPKTTGKASVAIKEAGMKGNKPKTTKCKASVALAMSFSGGLGEPTPNLADCEVHPWHPGCKCLLNPFAPGCGVLSGGSQNAVSIKSLTSSREVTTKGSTQQNVPQQEGRNWFVWLMRFP